MDLLFLVGLAVLMIAQSFLNLRWMKSMNAWQSTQDEAILKAFDSMIAHLKSHQTNLKGD